MRLSDRGKKSREMEGVMKNKKTRGVRLQSGVAATRTCHCNELLGWHMVRDIINY